MPGTDKAYVTCSSCNTQVELPARFCCMCGASLPSTATGGERSSGGMSSEITNLIKLASFGDVSEKLTAIARLKNEHSRMLLECMLGAVGIEDPITEAGKILGHIKAVPVVLDSGVLPDVLQQLRLLSEKGGRLVTWYASLALVELGDISEETAILLFANSHVLLSVAAGDMGLGPD